MTRYDTVLEDLLSEPYPSPIYEQLLALDHAGDDPQTRSWCAQRAGFVTIQYMAQLGWYDYFAEGSTNARVERSIRAPKQGRESMGHWVDLLRSVAGAKGEHGLLDIGYGRKLAARQLPMIATLVTGWNYLRIELNRSAQPERILAGVQEHFRKQQSSKVRLEDFVSTLNEYRNLVAHALEHDFPAHHPDLLRLINGWFVPALGEFLLHDRVRSLLCDHVWVRPTPSAACTRVDDDNFVLPGVPQVQNGRRITIHAESYFDPGDYLVKRIDPRSGTLLFPFAYSTRWPSTPKPEPEEHRGAAASPRLDPLELYDAVVELASLDGLTPAERERLVRIQALLELGEDQVQNIHRRHGLGDRRGEEPGDADSPRPEPTSASGGEVSVQDTVRALDEVLARAVPELERGFVGGEGLMGIDVGQGSLFLRVGATTLVSAWFWRSERGVLAIVGLYGDTQEGDAAFEASRQVLVTAGPEPMPGWRFAQASWKEAGYEASRVLGWEGNEPQRTARSIASAMLRLVGLLRPELATHDTGLVKAGALLGLEPSALRTEVEAMARRALGERWQEIAGLPWQLSPSLRLSRKGVFVDGRVGVDLRKGWAPGLYAGVLVDPKDHKAGFSKPLLGSDLVVVLSTHRNNERFDRAAYVASPTFLQLRDRLSRDSRGWDFHDHLAIRKPNLWHPIHLRRPLVELWAGASTGEERYSRALEAWRDGLSLLLEGGELMALEAGGVAGRGA